MADFTERQKDIAARFKEFCAEVRQSEPYASANKGLSDNVWALTVSNVVRETHSLWGAD